MVPQRPLRGRRPVGVEDVEACTRAVPQALDRLQQALGGLVVKEAFRLPVRSASAVIVRRRVAQTVDEYVERRRRDGAPAPSPVSLLTCVLTPGWTQPGSTIARARARAR